MTRYERAISEMAGRPATVDTHRPVAHPVGMGAVRPIPQLGGVLRDVRGHGRALRVSWHTDDDLVVLSLWDGPRCTGTVRLATADVPALVEALQIGLAVPAEAPAPREAAARDETPREAAPEPDQAPAPAPPDRPPDLLEN